MIEVYKTLQEATDDITDGKVGILPTDTLYGLVAKANDESAVQKLYDLKSRENKPGTLIATSISQLVELSLKRRYLTAVEQYWPGAVSVVIPIGPILDYLHQGKYSLAVRIPDDRALQALLEQTGALITSSANQPGKEPAKNITQAQKYFGDHVDFYVDGGVLNNKPSTIIRIVDDAVEVLREGAVKIDEETGRIKT